MKRIAFLSSINKEKVFGGAFLRISSIKEIYRKLGLQFDEFYLNDGKDTNNTLRYLSAVKYSKKTFILFKEYELDLSKYDVVHFDNLKFFSWKTYLKNDVQIIYNAHNLEFENFFDRRTNFFSNNLKRYELNQIKKSALSFVCSKREKEILTREDKSVADKIHVIPNLIDGKKYSSSQCKNIILFVGTLDYYPNLNAVKFLTSDFSQEVTEQTLNDFEFIIAGSNATKDIRDMIQKSIFSLVENPSNEEMLKLLSKTYVNLVPLQHGSGTRLKISEGIISRNIILSTPLGREGISSENIYESSLADFSSKLQKIITNQIQFKQEDQKDFLQNNEIESWCKSNKEILSAIVNKIGS